jgi:c(7)-type cytochrome triheme protein
LAPAALLALALALPASVGEPARAPAEGATPVPAAAGVPGRVVLDATSPRIGMPAVTFDHWNHRRRYTCRVCHVDLGFAMKAGETRVTARANEDGLYCGACHDGRARDGGPVLFRACWGWPRSDPARGCPRCHTGPDVGRGAYDAFARAMPPDVAGDVDWVAATRRRLVDPADVLQGVTPRRAKMRIDRDVELRTVGTWMNDVIFSHRRHVGWIACELCHPEVFPISRRGDVRIRMADMRAGRFCGACHQGVAFPLSTCQRCHGRHDPAAARP